MEYQILRSKRKTISLQVSRDGILVRAPFWVTDQEIAALVSKRRGWIEKQQSRLKQQEKFPAAPSLSQEEIAALAKQARQLIPKRVAHYAPLIGVSWGRITIRQQRSRWGSCSSLGNLNFNCLLMLAPPEVIDAVVVHELCHRKQMNHSPAFYAEIYRVYPEYDRWNRWLKQNGSALMQRVTGR